MNLEVFEEALLQVIRGENQNPYLIGSDEFNLFVQIHNHYSLMVDIIGEDGRREYILQLQNFKKLPILLIILTTLSNEWKRQIYQNHFDNAFRYLKDRGGSDGDVNKELCEDYAEFRTISYFGLPESYMQ